MTLAQLPHLQTRTASPDRGSATLVLNMAGILQSSQKRGDLTFALGGIDISMHRSMPMIRLNGYVMDYRPDAEALPSGPRG